MLVTLVSGGAWLLPHGELERVVVGAVCLPSTSTLLLGVRGWGSSWERSQS